MKIKIRIIGACGSGKSYIARELSDKYGINHYEMDNLVWDRSAVNLRFPIEVRDSMLDEIIHNGNWILEGAHYKWGQESFRKADLIFILQPNRYIRNLRVIQRFIKTRMGIEQCNYKQTVKNLYQMLFIYNRGYDQEGMQQILEITKEYEDKRIITRNKQEILEHIEEYLLADSRMQRHHKTQHSR
ncbi:AAA family ATPase [Paenibacillus sabinae]|uniref:DNA topology modulation protein FLAR-related protein n=1 Tax=Paenibacillus sabinae T27 TaxID=1268072 RepID=X5A4T9_9BACL|nr:DNA topology modulation protein FLAR-related protein [Paenibacillus sabinae T27]